MRHVLQGAVAAAVLASVASPAGAADPIVLKFSTASPPTSGFVTGVFVPWADKINKEAGDLFRIQVFNGFTLSNRVNAYERTMTDVIQIGHSGQNQTQGRFPQSDVVTLPFVSSNSEVASTAFWKIYANGTMAEEYKEVQPLILGVYAKAVYHFNKKEVRKVEDVRGLKIRVADRIGGQTVEALGAAAIQMGSTDTYKALQAGTIEGVFTSYGAVTELKMAEVTTWHVDAALGSSNAWTFMAKKKYDSLPAAARKILDDNSGEAASRAFGAFHQALNSKSKDTLAAMAGHTLYHLPADEEKRWIKATDGVIDDFVKSTPNGAQVLKAYREATAQVEKALMRN